MSIPAAVYQELHLVPSVLSADFSRLGEEITAVMEAGARIIHLDVMDGHFVPNITVGPLVVQAVAPLVHERGGWLSTHLMIERPEKYVEEFVKAGADAVSVHVEASPHLYHLVQMIKDLDAGAGLALNPATDPGRIQALVPFIDFVLVMTVNPGFGGQRLIPRALDKVSVLRGMLPERVAVEVDGGVKRDNIRQVVEMGANWVVAGSALFGAEDPQAEARILQQAMAGRSSM